MSRRIVLVIYVVLGALIAAQHNYLSHPNTIGRIVSAILAILLWPLVLIGISLHVG